LIVDGGYFIARNKNKLGLCIKRVDQNTIHASF
jgi:hypothetical protein